MFESLTERLGDVFDRLKRRGALSEDDVAAAMREVRVALLEADVALPIVRDFIAAVQERAVGQEVVKSVTPGQMVVKIVHDQLIEMLGGDAVEIDLNAPAPVAILVVGLQGSGKTTTTAKIAHHLVEKQKKRVLMASLDVRRPAAQEQLRVLGDQALIPTLDIRTGEMPVAIAKRAMDQGRREGYDVVLLDTAGRLAIDDGLMAEATAIRDAAKPHETLLVADAMTGQDAVNTAQAFHERVGISGIVLTRMDGDARGGAALSMRAVTGQPIKLIGTGEKMDALEPFHPERVAGRILDMGDVVGLVERAHEFVEEEKAEKIARRMQKGDFDLEDLLDQLRQLKKMGGLGGVMSMLPGIGKIKKQMADHDMDDSLIKRQEAIILSMTVQERQRPAMVKASRKKRIAAGSGTTIQEINKLLKQYQQMHTMMKKMKKMGGKLPPMGGGGMPGLGGGGLPPGMLPPGMGR
ncbi:MAG: signal recognition particle protein [Rhodospirillaceae bacterium]|nr:signal recognition particle protein [Rhodospirillaceae bacterium]MBT3808881.1 signal recognition particle protein [Rhodospirillaceae bacterium]MBT3930249.1 signal recognition particle protein [Rhodospirillaceae bacterium]MBT4773324.1 signal recognition particle protein [Rhodospirillaceae bacterium]MBT5769955.1 signal recognition particle protein [Rhodospirillaceae bacterium]